MSNVEKQINRSNNIYGNLIEKQINRFNSQLISLQLILSDFKEGKYEESKEELREELVRLIKNSASFLKNLGDE